MNDHRSPAAPSTGNPMSQRAADVLAWALGTPLPVPAEQYPAPADSTEQPAPVESAVPAEGPETAAPEVDPDAGVEAPAEPRPAPEPERSEENAPAMEPQEAADGGPERPHAAPDFPSSHAGRSWGDTEIEDACPCPRPLASPKDALCQRADQTRRRLHRLSALERRQATDLGRTRDLIISAQGELSRMVDELLAMVNEPTQPPAPVEPSPAGDATPTRPAPPATEPPTRPEASAQEQPTAAPVEAAEEGAAAAPSGQRAALLRVLDNQAAEIHRQFGPYGPHPHTRTGDARTDWVSSWLGHAPAVRFRGEQLTEDGWRRAPMTDPDGETSTWNVARTLATLSNGTPVEWAANGTVSVPGFRWTPMATCRPFPAGGRIDWAGEFTGATAPLAAPDSAWTPEPGTATAQGIADALRALPAHVDVSERAGEIKAYAQDGVYRFTPRP